MEFSLICVTSRINLINYGSNLQNSLKKFKIHIYKILGAILTTTIEGCMGLHKNPSLDPESWRKQKG